MERSESSVWIRDNFSNASVCRVNGSGLSTNGWTSSRGDIFCMASRSATAEIKANRIDVTEVLRCEIVEFVTCFTHFCGFRRGHQAGARPRRLAQQDLPGACLTLLLLLVPMSTLPIDWGFNGEEDGSVDSNRLT